MKPYIKETTLLKAMAHPTRLAVLEILRNGEQCVCHMEAKLGIRQASLSQQLMVLRRLGLVRVRRQGLNIFYRAAKPELFGILDALTTATGKHAPLAATRGRDCPCPKCSTSHRSSRISATALHPGQ